MKIQVPLNLIYSLVFDEGKINITDSLTNDFIIMASYYEIFNTLGDRNPKVELQSNSKEIKIVKYTKANKAIELKEKIISSSAEELSLFPVFFHNIFKEEIQICDCREYDDYDLIITYAIEYEKNKITLSLKSEIKELKTEPPNYKEITLKPMKGKTETVGQKPKKPKIKRRYNKSALKDNEEKTGEIDFKKLVLAKKNLN